MGYPINPRPKMVRPCFPAPTPKVKYHKPPTSGYIPEYDPESELTKEIIEAARKAGISIEGLNVIKPEPPKNVIIKGSGWIGPG